MSVMPAGSQGPEQSVRLWERRRLLQRWRVQRWWWTASVPSGRLLGMWTADRGPIRPNSRQAGILPRLLPGSTVPAVLVLLVDIMRPANAQNAKREQAQYLLPFPLPRFHAHRSLERLICFLMPDSEPPDRPGSKPQDVVASTTLGAAVIRRGTLTELREHTEANRDPFIRWYRDHEIAQLLRHDLEPLSQREANAYFSSIIMPLSQRGQCWAIHRRESGALIGTAAITDLNDQRQTCLFRIVIGEKDAWGHGFGTEATRLVAQEVFETLPVTTVRLEVFAHNPRARRAYERVGFRQHDRYEERVRGKATVLDILAMELTPEMLASNMPEPLENQGDEASQPTS